MVKKAGEHSDSIFVNKLHRYCLIDLILESDSFLDFENKLKKSKLAKKEDSHFIFQEFKLFNLVIKVEYELVTLIEKFYQNEIVKKEELYNFIFNKIKRFRYLSNEETEDLISEETDGEEQRLYTPHCLFYIAGVGLGLLIHMIKDYTNSFEEKSGIVEELIEFRDYRNNLIHNLLSSRIESGKEIKKAIDLGEKLEETLEAMTKKYKE